MLTLAASLIRFLSSAGGKVRCACSRSSSALRLLVTVPAAMTEVCTSENRPSTGFRDPGLDNRDESVTLAGMENTRLEFLVGPGGWLEVVIRPEQGYPSHLYVRLSRAEDGNWHPQGTLYGVATPEALPKIPLRRILLAVAASESLREKLAARLDQTPPEPAATDEWRSAFDGFVVPEPPPVEIKRPKGRNLSDEFYATVGEAYRVAVERMENPRTTIAESAGVSNEVAGRWVRQARKRGYLPATEPGKVTA
jgi:hypothetical protein